MPVSTRNKIKGRLSDVVKPEYYVHFYREPLPAKPSHNGTAGNTSKWVATERLLQHNLRFDILRQFLSWECFVWVFVAPTPKHRESLRHRTFGAVAEWSKAPVC